MGLIKTEIFSTEQNEIARLFKALAHPARIAILEHLFKSKTCICGDLVEEIGLAQPTISQHLKELKTLGIIKGTINGTSVCYCINQEQWQNIKNIAHTFFDKHALMESNCC
ncbi:helix-turn-helix transcriptional regulator [Sediminibacter sp. Hel_I_10]|uniref:ArsR/SmtB family transcription factor n=1 Tax=Sediminibacter sp. Hel_I_10 TaxID=1392490 RepID=UPI000479FE33|nr:metalloregulator ArsR/SmtB family transcription factor [Sediminibacter sp. Hel_I_10]